MSQSSGYNICSVDGSTIYKSENNDEFKDFKFTLLDAENKRLNFDRFDMTFDDSLDMEYLRDVVYPRHSKEMNGKHLLVGKDKRFTTAIINVTFKNSVRDFEHCGDGLYVVAGEHIGRELLVDHIYMADGEIKAIEVINQGRNNKKDYKGVQTPERSITEENNNENDLCKYFEYRDEELDETGNVKTPAAYYVIKNNKNEIKIKANKNTREIREYLYEHGFKVDGIDYVRYKRSAGSGREGSCLFIAKPLYEDMIKWSCCGLNSDMIKDKASWEAYISLTLSSMIDKINLSKESILLMRDVEAIGYDNVVAINRGKEKEGKTVELIAERKRVKYKNKIWDGEALLDESVFEELERINIERNKDKTKHGMMLLRNRMFKTCAFRTKLQKFFSDNGINDVGSLNGYTLAKSVSDIKLVVTESSIKYIKLAKEIHPNASIEEIFKMWLDVIYSDKKGSEFGVVKQDKKSGPMDNQCVYTNYQLINTLSLDENGVNDLVRDSMNLLHKIQNDPMYLRYQSQILAIDEDSFDEDCLDQSCPEHEVENNYRFELIRELLSRSDKAKRLQIYKDYRKDLTDSFKKRVKRGRIIVEGNYQTLFGNPLEFLYNTVGKSYTETYHPLTDGEIYTRRFDDGKTLLCARSPHITMGNVYVAKNKHVPEIDKYFYLGESNSIVCVNAIGSNIMQRLNGCDYDSDTMLITDNSIMLEAAKDLCENFPIPHSEIDNIDDTQKSAIKSATKQHKENESTVLCDLDIKISQNKVGEIVNLSQFLNSLYWHKLFLGETSELDEIYDDICKLAVISGIEIDRAKRDMHISAQSVLRDLRTKWKDTYVKGKPESEIKGAGGLPRFFVELIDKSGANRNKISKDAVLNAPLSYVYDAVNKDEGQNDSERVIRYTDFFCLSPGLYDQNAKRRAKGFLEYAENTQNYINQLNMKFKSSKSKRGITEEKVKSIISEAVKESEKYLKGEMEYWYTFEFMDEVPEIKKRKDKKEGRDRKPKTQKRSSIALYLLCYANDMKLIRKITNTEPMKNLKQDDTISKEEAYDIIYGHPHKIV